MFLLIGGVAVITVVGFIFGLMHRTMDEAWLAFGAEVHATNKLDKWAGEILVHLVFIALIVTRPITWSLRKLFVRS